MKANAPDRIFLEWYRIGDKKYRDWCIIPKTNDESVEYVHKDAFIEKACEYISNRIFVYPRGNFIEDFKKYMEEGE